MFRTALMSAAVLCLFAVAGCSTERPPTTPQSSQPAASKAELAQGLGRVIGQTGTQGKQNNVVVDVGGAALTSSMWRGLAHVAYSGTTIPAARDVFLGSGRSRSDMIRATKRPLDKDANYTELLYGYLAAIDPGGTTGAVEFYEDARGCETDLISREGKDGVVRHYLVDTTGWHDTMYEEMGEKPDRRCER
jgi:hypothetical protein